LNVGQIPIPTISMDIDVSGERPEDSMVDPAKVIMALRRASLESAELVKAAWVLIAQRAGVSSDGDYINGITVDGRVEVTEGNSSADLVEQIVTITNTDPNASTIENGHGAYSQVDRIRWGATPKMKRTKDGTWYLTIPFRHSAYRSAKQQAIGGITPRAQRTMMPAYVYNQAKNLSPSRGLNAGKQYTASGQYRAADRYRWGGRLGSQVVGGRLNGALIASRYQGMVKMSGGKGHNAYLTFRIMTQKSKGWIMPAKAGLHIAERLLAQVEGGELGRAIAELIDLRMREAVASGEVSGAPR